MEKFYILSILIFSLFSLSLKSQNVGIGTASPQEKLHIDGYLRGNQSGAIRVSTGSGYVDIGPKNGTWSHFETDRSRFYFNKGITVDQGLIGSHGQDLQLQTNGVTRITALNSNGNIGIGIASPTQKLDVNGNAVFRGSISAENNKSILYPEGGFLYDPSSSHSKYIVIWLPDNSSIRSMMNIKANFYKYSNEQAAQMVFSGYTYPTSPAWLNTSFSSEGYTAINSADFIVSSTGRFGIVLTNNGNLIPLSYSHIVIERVDLGYGDAYLNALKEGWEIEFASTYPSFASKTTRSSTLQAAGDLRVGNLGAGVLSSDASGNISSGTISWGSISGVPGDKWAGANNLTGSISRTGSVGIGTASPGYELDVVGSVRGRTNLYVGTGGGFFYNDSGSRITTQHDFYTNNANTYLYGDNTYLGNSSGDNIHMRANNFTWTGGSGGTINSDGKVGIGTTSIPGDVLLEVNGGVGVSRMGIGGAYNSNQVQGIWTIASNYKIDVANNDFGGQYGMVYAHTNAGTSTNKLPIANWGHQILFTNNGVRNAGISLTNGNAYFAGRVGIGVTAPSYDLHVNGRIKSNGINETSDIRYKKDISPLESSLEKLMQLNGVSYHWRVDEFPDLKFKKGKDLGVIAQEVEKIFPEVVDTDSEGYKSVQYSHLVPVLIEAIKEQQAIIEAQKKENIAQVEINRKQNEALEAMNLKIENLSAAVQNFQEYSKMTKK